MYNVGQIVYTILEDKFKIIPMKVVEKVVSTNLDGETTNFFAQIPSSKEIRKVNLNKFNHVFSNIEETKKHMVKNATDAIEDLAIECKNVEEKYFVVKDKIEIDVKPEPEQVLKVEESKNKTSIELENGQKANINLESIEKAFEKSPTA